MKRIGEGYAHEILTAVFFLLLVMVFFLSNYSGAMLPVLLLGGGALLVAGMVYREPMIIAGGIVAIGFAIMFSKVFI